MSDSNNNSIPSGKKDGNNILVPVIMIALLLIIIAVLYFLGEHFTASREHYRQGLNYPPDGSEEIAITGVILLLIWTVVFNKLYVSKLKGASLVAVNIFIVAAFFGILEFSLWNHTRLHPRPFRPDADLIWVRDKEPGNEKGGIADNMIPPKEPGEFRIIVAGDSTAEGQGVEERFSDILEKRLRETYPDRKIRVINAACAGYSIVQVSRLADMKLYDAKPDCMIISINNDPIFDYDEDKNRIPSGKKASLDRVLYKSKLYLLLRKVQLNREYAKNLKNGHFVDEVRKSRVSPEDVRKYYSGIMRKVKAQGGSVIVTAMPSNYPDFPEDDRYKNSLSKIATDEGALCLDIYNDWKNKDRKDVFTDVVHVDGEGHRIIAEMLLEFIVKNGVVGK